MSYVSGALWPAVDVDEGEGGSGSTSDEYDGTSSQGLAHSLHQSSLVALANATSQAFWPMGSACDEVARGSVC